MSKTHFSKFLISIYIFFTIFAYSPVALAGSLTVLSDTMSRLKASEASNHDIKFRSESGITTTDSISVGFNTPGFGSASVDYTDIDLQYGSSQSEVNGSCSSNCTKATLAGSAGSATWGASFISSNLVLSYPSSGGTPVAANDYVRILIGTNATYGTTGDVQMTNPASTGSKTITISTTYDTGSLAVAIVTNDQLSVTANVDPSLTFVITDNAVPLGTLSATSTSSVTETFQVGTNSEGGYTVTYLGDNLKHGNGTDTITALSSGGTSSIGSEQFGMNLKDNATPNVGAEPSGGTGAPASGYGTADNFKYVPNTLSDLASASGSTATTTFTISFIANIAAVTEAGNYSTTITLIATANF